MSLKDRYTPDVVAEHVARQELVAGTAEGAKALAGCVAEIQEYSPGSTVITEGSCEDAVYLLLAGRVRITVKGDLINYRAAGTHVGEMALVLGCLRTASVIAEEPCVVARVEGASFKMVANSHPKIWENMARVLARRLDERKRFIRDPNPRPYVFIGSSGEQRDVANLIKAGLTCPDIDCEVWSEPMAFPPGDSFLDTLLYKASKADYAIIVFGRDDRTISRGQKKFSPRDNVVFEAGLFMGAIGKKRTFVVKDQKTQLKMLSDLDGITVLNFRKSGWWWQKKHDIDVNGCCATISAIIDKERVR